MRSLYKMKSGNVGCTLYYLCKVDGNQYECFVQQLLYYLSCPRFVCNNIEALIPPALSLGIVLLYCTQTLGVG